MSRKCRVSAETSARNDPAHLRQRHARTHTRPPHEAASHARLPTGLRSRLRLHQPATICLTGQPGISQVSGDRRWASGRHDRTSGQVLTHMWLTK